MWRVREFLKAWESISLIFTYGFWKGEMHADKQTTVFTACLIIYVACSDFWNIFTQTTKAHKEMLSSIP